MSLPKILVILGPTASGKSDLAVKLAKKFNGEVISADSRQVYRGLNIGSGKITKKEMRGVPHYLLDVATPKKVFSVAQYKELADKAIKDILKRGKLPVICGGTGFYIDAVTQNIILPEVEPNKNLRKRLAKKSLEELQKILKKIDPKRFKTVDTKNKVRLIRAIEISKTLGKVPRVKGTTLYCSKYIGINWSKEKLGERILKRLTERMKQGMVDEVRNLHKKGLSWKRLESLGLEYKNLALYLQMKISKKQLLDNIYKESIQYSKRQMTWFRRNKEIHWLSPEKIKESDKLVRFFLGE